MPSKRYDLIVIGAGSGLDVADAAMRNYGWRAALVENGPLGGTCLNRGCIPSKIIIHAADVVETIQNAHKFGVRAKLEGIDFERVTRRASDFVDADSREIEEAIKKEGKIDLYKTDAEFIGERTLKVGGDTISGERVLIAAGARPSVPPIEGLDRVNYLTSTEALRVTRQPKSMIILGGGYIAAELGNFYGTLGTKVTIIQRGPLLINREDGDVARAFTELFSKKFSVLLNSYAKKAEKKGSTYYVTVAAKNGGTQTVEGDALFVAVGIKPNSDSLALNKTGVEVNERGHIKVNEYMETSAKNVWALGDIVGRAPFKHGANWEAKYVYWNIRGEKKFAVDYSAMPRAIFTSPQIASVGLTEEQSKEKGIEYEVRRHEYRQTGMGKALEEKDGFVKFIVDANQKKILGCHILGPDASVLIHEVVVAMKAAGGYISAIKNSIHIHPALNEVVQRAL